MRIRLSAGLLVFVLALSSVAVAQTPKPKSAGPLYGGRGVHPEAVVQGALGSCYFHSVIAALAAARPELLEKMITENEDGTYTVKFADGTAENVYPEDVKYTRDSGYDLSDGVWVTVLFRAYAQKVLRKSLMEAVMKTDLYPPAKLYAVKFVGGNDSLLLAYDRAIRSQVSQDGQVDRDKLKTSVALQLKPLPVPDTLKTSFQGLLESSGAFDMLAETVRSNGEMFGAYRAVGQGGLVHRVMQTLTGSVKYIKHGTEADAQAQLARAWNAHVPIAACTGGSRWNEAIAKGQPVSGDDENWYVDAHCYTVLSYDPEARSVRIRNPWGRHPDPDGEFTLTMDKFVPAFWGIVISDPNAAPPAGQTPSPAKSKPTNE